MDCQWVLPRYELMGLERTLLVCFLRVEFIASRILKVSYSVVQLRDFSIEVLLVVWVCVLICDL